MNAPTPVPVLLVDDRPENLTALAALLGDLGLELVLAQSGNEALRLTLKSEFALVLLDVQMPDMDGFETAELLRANPKTRRLPIIFVTAGMKDDHYRFKGYEAGAVDYLMKPIEPRELRSKVRVFCDLFLQRKDIERHELLLEALVAQRTIALRESEAFYRAILESAADPVARFDRRWAHVYANAQSAAFSGMPLAHIVGKTHRELGFPASLCTLLEGAIEKVFLTGEPTTVAFNIQSAKGPAFLELKLSPEKDLQGDVSTVLGMTHDLTERHQLEEVRQFLSQASWVASEEPFFEALARYLASCMGMDYVCIDRLEGDSKTARTLAIYFDGHFEPNTTYTLQDTPCGDVLEKRVCCFPAGVRHQFPTDVVLQEMVAESYVGTTLWNSRGEAIGLIAVIGRRPLANPGLAEKILELVSLRAAGELERKLVDDTLRQVSQAVEQSPVTIVITDLDGRIQYTNPKFSETSGYSVEEVLGKNPRILKSGEQPREVYRNLWDTIKAGRMWEGELHNRKKNGELFWEHITISPIRDEAGTLTSYVAVKEDITAQRQARADLRRLTDLLEASGAIAKIGGWEVDLVQNTLFWTSETYRIHETTPEAYSPSLTTALEFYTPESRPLVTRAVEEAIAHGQDFDLELELITALGRRIQIRTTGKVQREGDRPVRVVGAFRDITEENRLEAERQGLEKEIQNAQKLESLGSLAGGIAHDMNNVLAAVMGMASVLKAKYAGDPGLGKALDTILHASVRGRDLVKGLTNFAHRGVAETLSLDLNDLLQKEVDLLRRTTLEKIEFVLDLAKDLPQVMGDSSSLGNAVMNICVNAIHAMPEGGALCFQTRQVESQWIEVSITDSGMGMSPEVMARATDPFFTTKPFGKGTGLGLSIVYGTLKAHGGQLELKSSPGQGTTVLMKFPVHQGVPAAFSTEPPATAVARPGLHILLVDDDDLIRDGIPPLLQMLGHSVELAASGREALARLALPGPAIDLVIMDHNMPGMTGAATLRQIRSMQPALPLILATGFVDEDVRALLRDTPGISLLSKPYSSEEIQRCIEATRPAFHLNL